MDQRHSGLPFDDIRNLARSLPTANEEIAAHTASKISTEIGAESGRVGLLCEWYARWSGRSPIVHRPLLTLFAGTHAAQNKADGGEAAAQQLDKVNRVAAGDAVVNRLCTQHDLGLKLFDLALQLPVADISQEPALDEKTCAGTIAFGMEAIAGGSDLLTVCAIGADVEVSSLAILGLLTGRDMVSVCEGSNTAVPILEEAITLNKSHRSNSLEVLRRVGGRETAALCGAILAARTEHVPVIVGSLAGLAARAILFAENPDAVRHCVLANGYNHPELAAIVDELGIGFVLNEPVSSVVEANAVIATSIVQSACKHFPVSDQATRDSAS